LPLHTPAAYATAAVAGGYAPVPVPPAHSAVPGSSGGGGGGGAGSLHTVPSLGSSLAVGGMSLGGMTSMPAPAPHVALSLTFFRNHAEQVGRGRLAVPCRGCGAHAYQPTTTGSLCCSTLSGHGFSVFKPLISN
jgi:hypothetical protein